MMLQTTLPRQASKSLFVLIFLVAAGLGAAPAPAQELKFQGPVKLFVGFAAGGQSDILARTIGDKLKDRIGRAVIIDNKTGAAGRLAVESLKSAPADGSALVLANSAQMTVAPLIFKDLPYDPLKDFAPVAKTADFQIAVVTGKQTGAKTFQEALAWLKANPDKANSGNPGSGSIPHLYGIELARETGIKLQAVPYRGGAPIVAAITQGELAIGWAGITDFIEQHRAGQLSIIAVTGTKRSPQLPSVPTFTELSIPALADNGWLGLFAPVGTPADVVALYEKHVGEILAEAPVRERLEGLGLIVSPSTSAQLKAYLEADHRKWKPIIERAGITQ